MSDDKRSEIEEGIERSLRALWLQNEENELLKLIDCFLQELGFTVVALVFDGLMVQSRGHAQESLTDALRRVEVRLKNRAYDWHIKLKEKGLHNLQNEPVKTAVKAREVIHRVLSS